VHGVSWIAGLGSKGDASARGGLGDSSPFDLDKYAAGELVSDKYRLETPLGFGSMGMLWRARNDALDAPVALKLIRKDARWSLLAERLLREARVMASLRHSAIVRVFDYGMTTRGDPFIVMELLQGESLREMLDRETALSAVEAVRLLLPVLDGLDCAHARGVVHRDLKPDNIFVSRDDRGRIQPKLLDFGIAKLKHASSRLTTGGVVLGSPAYMAPEQAEGAQEIDARVDVWAAAVMLYEMISDHPPWDANNTPALLRAIVHDDAPSIAGLGGVDAHLWSILEMGLAKKRDSRWGSCRDFGWALAGWLTSHSVVDDVSGSSLVNTWLAQGPTLSAKSVADGDASVAPVNIATRAVLASSRLLPIAIVLAASIGGSFIYLGLRGRPASSPAVALSPIALVQPASAPDPRVASDVDAEPTADLEGAKPTNPPAETTNAPASTAARPKSSTAVRAKPVTPPPAAIVPRPAVRAAVDPSPAPSSAQAMDFGF
jgi:serine/threonine protein kinase